MDSFFTVFTGNRSSNCDQLLCLIMTVLEVVDELVELFRVDLLEEAEVAGVDSDYGSLGEAESVYGIERRAVSADADDQIGVSVGLGGDEAALGLELFFQSLAGFQRCLHFI